MCIIFLIELITNILHFLTDIVFFAKIASILLWNMKA